MATLTFRDLVRLVDELRSTNNVRGFVCTPETFRRIKDIGAEYDREQMFFTGLRPTSSPFFGSPVRVEIDPKPEPGEVVLTLPSERPNPFFQSLP